MPKKLNPWDKVNWHKILSRDWNSFKIICWNCWAYVKKSKDKLYKNKRCEECQRWNHKYSQHISTMCWILWLKLTTVRSRLARGWTVKEALYQTKRVWRTGEWLTLKDMKYLVDFNEAHYEENKRYEESAYIKYKTRINYD